MCIVSSFIRRISQPKISKVKINSLDCEMAIVLSLILVSIFLPIVGISFLRLPRLTLAGRRGKS
jgi:hypothetical protein